MLKWTALFLCLAVACGCLGALGVGLTTLGQLLLSLAMMAGIALLIAWLFLRKRNLPR